MDEKEYSVSEAVRLIGVESHVLRYWEEELQIAIRRTSQGHRIYSQENIDTFCQVKKLKEKGIQLKAIRVLLLETESSGDTQQMETQSTESEKMSENGANSDIKISGDMDARLIKRILKADVNDADINNKDIDNTNVNNTGMNNANMNNTDINADRTASDNTKNGVEEWNQTYEILPLGEKPDNLRQFELILKRMMEEVVAEQNEKLERAIADMIRDEIEDLYLQYYHMTQEAAAAAGPGKRREGKIAEFLRKFRR